MNVMNNNQPATDDESVSGEQEDDVMISVQMVKSILEAKRVKKSPRNKGQAQRKLSPEVRTTRITILAIGNAHQLHIPQSFCYRDPLNCWRSVTKFVKSPTLKSAIQGSWEKFKENSKHKHCSVPNSMAKHIVLNEELKEIELVAEGGEYDSKVKLRAKSSLLELMSHAPSENALDHSLEKSETFHEMGRMLVHDDCSDLSEIKDMYFREPQLPTSSKYDTVKLKNHMLPIPNQLGSDGACAVGELYLLWHNAAHMKFTELTYPHKEYTDDQIRLKLGALCGHSV